MTARAFVLRAGGAAGAVFGYGCLAAFLSLIGLQVYLWFMDGEWTHIGVTDGLRALLGHLGVTPDSTGRLSALSHWLDAPVRWLGLHKVLEVLPASLALFAISILGNSVFVYLSDRLREYRGGSSV
jgi:hypothetical protein